MENNKYSPVKKGILIMLNAIFGPILLVSIVITILFFADSGGDWKMLSENKEYRDSQALEEDLKNEAHGLVSFVKLKELFETKGKLDENKIINVLDYSKESYVPGRSEHPMGYRLGDLLNWASSYTEWEGSGRAIYSQDETYSGTVSEEAVDDNGDGFYDNDEWLEEMETTYQPDGYKSIDDYVEQNKSNRQQCVNALMQTLSVIKGQVDEYKNYEAMYLPKNSNLVYEVTNMETNQKFTNRSTKATDVNEVAITEEINDYKIEVGVDTLFPVKDSFYHMNENYNRFAPYMKTILILMLTGLLIGGTTFVWVTLLSGHSAKKDGITLLAIDKLPTEINIVAWGIIGFMVVGSISVLGNFDGEGYDFYNLAISIIMIASAYGLFLTGYLSLVRIIKAGRFVKNSICYRLYKGVGEMLYNRKTAEKALAAFAIYLVINFVLSAGSWWSGLGFFLALVFNVFIAWAIYKDVVMRRRVLDGIKVIAAGDLEYQIPIGEIQGSNKELAEAVNKIGDGLHRAVATSIKNERMKTELITNVSHDIKTPLTSIVNYVDLLKRENIQDEKIKGYIDILDNKSQRLKQLTEDLVEASKVSSGNITLELMNVDFDELLQQTIGEFEDKFKAKELELIINHPNEPVVIEADGRRIWRVIENLFNNIVKYAMPSTRVYIDLYTVDKNMKFTVKNVSEHALNIKADELTERFIRGDVSRSTEGSGLGLSIAKELTTLQKGDFDIYLDGDLFKVTITFSLVKE